MANYVKFKQGLKKDFNTTNQPLTNGMIYFVIDENNHGSIYYDTIVDGKKATKNGTVHRVKFSGLPIKITGSVIGTGVISQNGETIEINTSTNHSHGLAHQDFTVTLSNDDTNLKWTRLGNQNGGGFWLKSIRGQAKAPAWFLPDYSAGIAFGGADTKGIISVRYSQPGVRFAGGNGDAPVWYFTITGANDKTYDLSKIGGHSSDSAKLDHNVTFKIASTADATKGGSGTATNLSGSAVDLYLPTKISGFDLLQATRFQGNADTSSVAAKLGRGGNTSLPMTFNWSGQGGQPTWLWGGENGTDMYVYNPSNFRVAHSVNTAGLDHNITFKISKVADATIGETGITTKLTENAITFTIPSSLSGFNNIQSTRFQGTADNADTVDYFHMAEEKYKYETTKTQPTSGADWCIKISTPDWNRTSETIYLTASGSNTSGTVILKTGSRQNNWWGYATSYNGTGIVGVYKLVSNSDDVYIKVNGAYTSVRIRTTFDPRISIPATIPDYKFTSVPYQGGFFSNAIYTDTLTFTTPKYWANVPISDNSKTDTQPTFNTAYVSNWWRSTGNTGWWNETHRGGITMEDDIYVKVAGNKSFLIPNGSLKIGGNGDIFFATGYDDATLKIYGQTNTDFGTETIVIQTCFDNQDPQTSGYTTQYANRCNLLLQPRGGQVYIGKNLTTPGDVGYKLFVDGSQWTSGSQWVNGNLFFTDITGNTTDTGMSLKGVYGRIGGDDGWRIAGGARANNAGYLEIATCNDANEPIYVRQYGGGGNWNGYVSLARTFTLLDVAGRSRAPELFEAKKVHVNSLSDQSVAIADIGYQFQVTGTSNFTDRVDISGVTTHHNNIQIDTNYSIAKPGKGSAWYGSHTNAMIRMTSINGWSPLLAQKATDGYWVLGHYNEGDFKNQWLFGYLADSNLEGTTGASNSLTTTYRLLNIGGNDNQRMFVSAKYNAAVGSGTQPVYVQSNGNVATCSYSLNATIEAGTANRMAYYKAANQIGSSGHYVTSSQVGINSNTTHDFTFYVGGNSYFSNLVTVYAGNNLGVKIGQTNITAIDGSLILQNNTALRFGSSEWDWNKWAGLKYVPSSKALYLGLADNNAFAANSTQTFGKLYLPRITYIENGIEGIGSERNYKIVSTYTDNGTHLTTNSWLKIANVSGYFNFNINITGEWNTGSPSVATINICNRNGTVFITQLSGFAGSLSSTIRLGKVSTDSWDVLVLHNGASSGSRGAQYYTFTGVGNITVYQPSGADATSYSTVKDLSLISIDGNLLSSGNYTGILDGRYVNVTGDTMTGNLNFANNKGIHGLMAGGSDYWEIIGSGTEDNGRLKIKVGDNATTDWLDFEFKDWSDTPETPAVYNPMQMTGNKVIINCRLYEKEWIQFDNYTGLYSPNNDAHLFPNNISAYGQWAIKGSKGSYSGIHLGENTNYMTIMDSGEYKGLYQQGQDWIICYRKSSNQVGIRTSNLSSYSITCNGDVYVQNGWLRTTGSAGWYSESYGGGWHMTDSIYIRNYGGKTTRLDNLCLGADNNSYRLYVNGTSYFTDYIRIPNNKSLIQDQNSTSNYTSIIEWRKGGGAGQSDFTYNPQVGQHNTGGADGSGSVCVLPYATSTSPWGGTVGLFITKNKLMLDNCRVPTTGNTTGTIGSATVPVYSDNGVLKTITSYSGNAATATTASKLSRNAGSATKPIYFSGGVPVQCNDTLGVNISGNAASATYTTQLLGVQNNSSNTPYSVAEGNLIRAVWNVKSDNRWYLKAGSYNCRVNYADNAGNADTVDGYHAADLFSGGYKTTLNLSTLDNNLYYPVTGTSLPYNGYHKIKVSVQLDSGTKPSWATHSSGFTTNVELYTTAYGWGTTQGETIVLNDSYNFTNCGQVVGFTQNGNNSTPVLWLRGGGQYYVECDYNASWTVRTSLYYTYGSAGDTYAQTVQPQSSYPGIKAGNGGASNGVIRAGQVYGAVWNDYAEYRQTKEYIQPGYCVIETGKGDLIKSSERLQPGANIVSDTFGFAIGETEQTKTPLAVSGRVLAYPYEDRDSYKAGDPVCSGPNGTISKMTREEVIEYPDRIIGTVSEIPDYEVWGTGNVKVNNRIWIKVK